MLDIEDSYRLFGKIEYRRDKPALNSIALIQVSGCLHTVFLGLRPYIGEGLRKGLIFDSPGTLSFAEIDLIRNSLDEKVLIACLCDSKGL